MLLIILHEMSPFSVSSWSTEGGSAPNKWWFGTAAAKSISLICRFTSLWMQLLFLRVDRDRKGKRMAERGGNLEDGSAGTWPLQVTVINVACFAIKEAEHVVGVYQLFLWRHLSHKNEFSSVFDKSWLIGLCLLQNQHTWELSPRQNWLWSTVSTSERKS